ncbi:hypothetical protein [Oceanobacillus damuensis]|uniref:hypothetical protein n=1 Tax=Oceanobacillus damuensis TaxID=937928 RepID=UPI0008364F12|nr:hypothetical protein [Oceanobacillus damuensis]
MDKMSIEQTYDSYLEMIRINRERKVLQHKQDNHTGKFHSFFRHGLTYRQFKKASLIILTAWFVFGLFLALLTTGWMAVLFFPVSIIVSIVFALPKALLLIVLLGIFSGCCKFYNRYLSKLKRLRQKHSKIQQKLSQQSIVPRELQQKDTLERMVSVYNRSEDTQADEVIRWFQRREKNKQIYPEKLKRANF